MLEIYNEAVSPFTVVTDTVHVDKPSPGVTIVVDESLFKFKFIQDDKASLRERYSTEFSSERFHLLLNDSA